MGLRGLGSRVEEVFEAPGVIVVKVGSSTLVDERGRVDRAFMASLCDQAARLVGRGLHPIIVSSGAVAAGFERLGLPGRPQDVPGLQACAAAGQAALTEAYAAELSRHGIPCGQLLLTRRELTDRESYLNARNTIGRLLSLGAIPVINENDTISVSEFAFGDNDMLGAIVSSIVNADLYVILSDVDGLYSSNPQADPGARLIPRVDSVGRELEGVAGSAGSPVGTGGMVTKLRAGRAMLAAGIPMVICRGRARDVLVRLLDGEEMGTRFEARHGCAHESARKLWIGLAEVARGSLYIDEGAYRAVTQDGASVLPVGVTRCVGSFSAGDVVNLRLGDDTLVGRGVVRYGADDMRRVMGLKLDVIARFIPQCKGQPAIHRDELLVL